MRLRLCPSDCPVPILSHSCASQRAGVTVPPERALDKCPHIGIDKNQTQLFFKRRSHDLPAHIHTLATLILGDDPQGGWVFPAGAPSRTGH